MKTTNMTDTADGINELAWERAMSGKVKAPKIRTCGYLAVHSDLPLFVRDLSGHWVAGDATTRERAKRMSVHAMWIYGVEKKL